MCWSCNPYCGGCKPPKPRPVRCPFCNVFNFPDRTSCVRCAHTLPPVPRPSPVICLYIGESCANPCQRHKKPPAEGEDPYCLWHTPLDSGRQESEG